MIGVNTSIFQPSAIAAAVDLALFSLLNETTIVPEIGTHSSFTAGAGFIKNSDGYYQALSTNCARFKNARYVENFLGRGSVSSEDINDGTWNPIGTVTINNSTQFTSPLTNDTINSDLIPYATKAGDIITVRVRIHTDNAAGKFRFNIKETGIGGALANSYSTIGTSDIEHTETFVATGGGTSIELKLQTNLAGQVTTVTNIQLEVKTSYVTANQIIPSEYVSTNVLSAPYHGLGADGVKLFNVELANTVLSKIVTDVIGTVAITGIEAILYEPASTNTTIQGRDFTTSWSLTGATTAQDATGFDNVPNQASTLTDTGAGFDTCILASGITSDSTRHILTTRILKDNDETRFPEIELAFTGGTVQKIATQINTKTGAKTDRLLTGTGESSVVSDGIWWLVTLQLTNNSTGNVSLKRTVYPALGLTLGGVDASASGSIIIDTFQTENSESATSFIETFGSSVTRTLTDHEVDAPIGYTDDMTVSFTFTTKDIQSVNAYTVSFTDSGVSSFITFLSGGAASKVFRSIYGTGAGTISLTGTTVLTDNTEYKVLVWLNNSDGGALFVDGAEEAANITAPIINKAETKINIGNSKAGTSPVLGLIKNVVIKKQDITKAEALIQAAAL